MPVQHTPLKMTQESSNANVQQIPRPAVDVWNQELQTQTARGSSTGTDTRVSWKFLHKGKEEIIFVNEQENEYLSKAPQDQQLKFLKRKLEDLPGRQHQDTEDAQGRNLLMG